MGGDFAGSCQVFCKHAAILEQNIWVVEDWKLYQLKGTACISPKKNLNYKQLTEEMNINYRRSKGVVSQVYMTATRRYPSNLQ